MAIQGCNRLCRCGGARQRVRDGRPGCPTIKTTNDMPITLPPSLDALGLVPFQVNPHYFTGSFYIKQDETYMQHFGETRDHRIREFHEMNDAPVVGLWEGGILRRDNEQLSLHGAPARLFRKGQPAEDLEPGAQHLHRLLQS